MKERIKNAIDLIDVPNDICEDVREGIVRVKRERNGITMNRSVKRIASIAAAFVLLVGVAVGAAKFSDLHISKYDDVNITQPDNTPDVENISTKVGGLSVRLLGVSDNKMTVSISNTSSDSRFDGLTDIDLGTYAIVDKNGNIIASDSVSNSKLDIETLLTDLNSKVDPNATEKEVYEDMNRHLEAYHVVYEAIENEYKIYVSSLKGIDKEGNVIEVKGAWESPFRLDTVLDGTAFIAEDGDVSIEFVKNEDGSQDLTISINDTSKYPYSEVVKIWPTVYFIFNDDNGELRGSSRNQPYAGPAVAGSAAGFIDTNEIDGQITIVAADKANYSIYICDFGIELANGERYELQGSWRADFIGEREPRTARQQYIDAYKRILENAEKLGDPNYALRWKDWALEVGIIDPVTGELYEE